MHHIVADGWSVDVLLHELATLYRAFCADRPSPLPALPVQAADVAGWQREQLMGQELQSQLAYWRQQLTDSVFLELPTDRPRPAVFSYRGRRLPLRIDAELTAAIKRLAQQHDATVFMALLSAFQILLARYSGQSDVCVGSPIANRTRTEMEDLIGFFANTLVLRTKLDDNPSFLTLLDRVRKVCLSAFAHQDLPFERLVEELKVERDASRNPLFQVMFVLQNAPARPLTLLDLTVEPVAVESEIAKFDLTLDLEEQADGSLLGALEYATDLFDSARIERMAGHLVQLLRGVVANPSESVAKLPLLCKAEEQQILVQWNASEVPFSEAECVHTPFEHQAMRTPDAVAVVFEDRQLTYRELNQRANQLAHHLILLGVQPGTLAGLCMDRSLDLVVVLLAILKAGGACPARSRVSARMTGFDAGRCAAQSDRDQAIAGRPRKGEPHRCGARRRWCCLAVQAD